MAMMDTIRKAMKGRSGMVERVIDAAVDRAGRYSETLKRHGEGVKARARHLDDDRAGGATSAAAPAPTPRVPDPPDTTAPPTTTGEPKLRGSLAPRPATPDGGSAPDEPRGPLG